VGTEPMRYARGGIHQRAGLEFLGRVPDLDHATAGDKQTFRQIARSRSRAAARMK
jgi:hypothetical protein